MNTLITLKQCDQCGGKNYMQKLWSLVTAIICLKSCLHVRKDYEHVVTVTARRWTIVLCELRLFTVMLTIIK